MKKLYQITLEGKKELEKELGELKARRSEVAAKIAEARDFGDLSENAEYDVAREEQGLVETRISEIEDVVQNADIIKNPNSNKQSNKRTNQIFKETTNLMLLSFFFILNIKFTYNSYV